MLFASGLRSFAFVCVRLRQEDPDAADFRTEPTVDRKKSRRSRR
jgi:hypothetical protein